ANVATEIKDKFSAIGYNGKSAEEVENINKDPWFHNNETKANGQLVTSIYWDKEQPYARFYGISPHAAFGNEKIKLSNHDYKSTPYVDFQVEKDVKNQKDLMTACSDVVHYDGTNTASAVDLKFRHALTAVRFKVGQNLSYNKTIKKVEIRGAKSEGRYTLASGKNGNNAEWSEQETPTTFALSDLNVSTSTDVNQVIIGENNDNGVFYMVPQDLKGVSVYIYFSDNTTVKTKLSGSWEAGTTKTYALSEKKSSWQYELTVTGPTLAEYEATSTGDYSVQSYRMVDGKQEPVAWEVVGYDNNNDNTFSMDEKPQWLTSLSAMKGDGGVAAEKGKAMLSPGIVDYLDRYNKDLQGADSKGNAGNYYNLSNVTGAEDVQNTANCYLISAPGYYRIPLVYGNAIKDGRPNYEAFKTDVHGANVLQNFKDHEGKDIRYAYIDTQNSDNLATKAEVLWEEERGIVENPSINGFFMNFHISKEKIRSGNAVIVVKNSQGVIMWSWHLWFAKKEALDVIAVKNKEGKTYNFTKETVGFSYLKWKGTDYKQVREVRVKIAQTIANNGVKKEATITISQKPGGEKSVSSTLYQFGRKDPFPADRYEAGAYSVKSGQGLQEISTLIQNPGTFYYASGFPHDAYKTSYTNLWSINNTAESFNDNNVVKTIYDPSPVGFKMPPSNAFTGFTLTGTEAKLPADWKVSGSWDKGWHFKTGVGSGESIYFPATGYRDYSISYLREQDEEGRYWAAIPYENKEGCALRFTESLINPLYHSGRSSAFAVRPIAEK
ncbi:fimbrillin family protein, partial [Bacteroides pyogenes]|uniref:fimbrillin family protein n=2 Tax=Bacteroidales TaxID=171549 RepID=UPI002FD9B8EB